MLNQVRIIGGRFRARRLSFPNLPELRPSTDRLRVTLFNWLQPHLYGAHCLDTFAGSGVLGLEALSRGAAKVTFLDQAPLVIKALQSNAEKLGCQASARILHQDSLQFLKTTDQHFDLIFLDPPFHSPLLREALQIIQERQLAKQFVYIETAQALNDLDLKAWQIVKHTKIAAVTAALLQM